MPYLITEGGIVEIEKGPNKILADGEMLTCHNFGLKYGFDAGTVHSRVKRIVEGRKPYSHLFDKISKIHSDYRKNPNVHTIQMREIKKKEKVDEERIKQKRLTDNEEYYRQLRLHMMNTTAPIGGRT